MPLPQDDVDSPGRAPSKRAVAGAARVYRFGPHALNAETHELTRNGQPVPLPPRAFAVLEFLVENRRRVVTNEELTDVFWGGATLSPTVIARTVMKVRQALADDASAPRMIANLHGVGYRFVASTEVDDERVGAADDAGALAIVERVRLAILPFENRTSDAHLDWVCHGLPCAVVAALEADERLALVSPGDVASAMGEEPGAAHFERGVVAATSLLGAACVAGAFITTHADGYALHYRIVGEARRASEGVATAHEVTSLAEALSHALEAALFGGDAIELASECRDPLANQLMARAAQALQHGHADHARHLLQVVLDLSPGSLSSRLAYLRGLVTARDPGCVAFGEALLRDAAVAASPRLTARAQALLAEAAAARGDRAAAVARVDRARERWEPHRDETWAQQVAMSCALTCVNVRDFDRAVRLLHGAAAAAVRSGNRVQAARAVMNTGSVQALQGDLPAALQSWLAVLAEPGVLVEPRAEPGLRVCLAEVTAALGRLDDALAHCDATVSLLERRPQYDGRLEHVCELCIRYAEAGRADTVALLLRREEACLARAGGALRANALVASAQPAAARREFAAARLLLREALDVAIDGGQWWIVSRAGPLAIHNDLRAGRFAQAEALAIRLLALPGLESPTDIGGMRLHASALALHRAGRADDAMQQLEDAAQRMHQGRWRTLATLDRAWLAIETGRIGLATQLLGTTFAWPGAHPVGRLMKARLDAAAGRHEAAQRSSAALAGDFASSGPARSDGALGAPARGRAFGAPPAADALPPSTW